MCVVHSGEPKFSQPFDQLLLASLGYVMERGMHVVAEFAVTLLN